MTNHDHPEIDDVDFEDVLNRSSLGTPGAARLRRRTAAADVERTLHAAALSASSVDPPPLSGPDQQRRQDELYELTAVERAVLEAAVAGKTVAQISSDMVMTDSSVRTHLRSAYRKQGLQRRAPVRHREPGPDRGHDLGPGLGHGLGR